MYAVNAVLSTMNAGRKNPLRPKLTLWRGSKDKKKRNNKQKEGLLLSPSFAIASLYSEPYKAHSPTVEHAPSVSCSGLFQEEKKDCERSISNSHSLRVDSKDQHQQQQQREKVCEDVNYGIVQAAAALDTAGNDLTEKGDYKNAMQNYVRALELKQQSLDKKEQDDKHLLASVATSINNIGYLRQRSGTASHEEIMAAYQDSLQIKREILGEHHLSVGKTLNNIGSVHYSRRNFKDALDAYQEASSIMLLNLGEYHLDVATVHSNIGDVFMAQGRSDEAHDEYKLALNIRWMNLDEHDPKVIRLLEKIASLEMDHSVCSQHSFEDDETRIFQDDETPLEGELHSLHTEVKADIKEITDLRRKMALDMVKDKLRIIKGFRDVENIVSKTPPRTPPPALSPAQRSDALSSVKERLAQMRERKAMGESTNRHDKHGDGNSTVAKKLNLESALGCR